MPILALDTETSGLNAKEFRLGCVMREDEVPHIFTDKIKMLDFVKNEAKKEKKRGHNTFNYAHNMEYDAYAFTDLKDKQTKYISFRPFIAIRKNLWMLDTVAITRAPLSEVATWVGMEKMETPQELKDGISREDFENNFELKARTSQYCANDTLIVLRLVKMIKQKLLAEGIKIKRLISAGQIGAAVFMNHVKKTPLVDSWIDYETGGFRTTTDEADKLIGRACRGARVEAFKTGRFEKAWYFDANSLYPHILSTMTLPNLAAGERVATLRSLETDTVGIARAIIRKPDDMIGIPVRVAAQPRFELAFPRQKAIMCGTYTLQELREYEKNGCEITELKGIEYPAMENSLREFIHGKYELRLHSAFEKAFWKLVLNNIVGKFAQKRESKEICFDDLGTEKDMKRKGFTLKDITEDLGMYVKSNGVYRSRAYCPILYASVTAGARLALWGKLREIREKDRLYSDTDSIICKNGGRYKDSLLKMGTDMGEWKLEGVDTLTVWGKKTYSFGNERIVTAGASKREVTPEMARTGTLTYKKMIGMRSDSEHAGEFTEEKRELKDTVEKHMMFEKRVAAQRMFIDEQEPADLNLPLKLLKLVDE